MPSSNSQIEASHATEATASNPTLHKMSISFLGGLAEEPSRSSIEVLCNKEHNTTPQTIHVMHPITPNSQMNGIRMWSFKISKTKPKNGAFQQRWSQKYEELKDFRRKYGHVRVTRVTRDFESLGNWVADQRRKLRTAKLTEEQFNLLNQIGMEWDRSYYFRPSVFETAAKPDHPK